ncbi:MAG: NAD(P)-dependent oxidoreductase [Muribaculaceae bacterium]|nr:NAD(P)-dependent oxidoreductase [Muribaculaceae bacterium]
MKKIFLTGATGVMGRATLRELIANRDKQGYEITILARPSKKNRKQLTPFIQQGIKVIWGDLMDYDAVRQGVDEADIVLHIGGMVSPMADWFPEKTLRVNVGAAENIVRAAQAKESRGEEVALVYIGSVSQYGPRNAPRHWGRAGDPIAVAKFDAYALSKVRAEKIFAESGVKKWVSLRQTGILHTGLLFKASDPISFHVPLHGVLEWVTDEDSGRLMERICREDVPDSFWGNYYNIGGGEQYRLTNYEFVAMILSSLGCPPPEKSFDARWFATDNFHGMWYEDSDRLDRLFHFRSGEGPREYFDRKKRELPWFFSLSFLAPGILIKNLMRLVALKKPLGTLSWFKNDDKERIDAYFNGIESWKQLPTWQQLDLSRPSAVPQTLDHGYDESRDISTLTDDDLQKVAAKRGGRYLGQNRWQCAEGHEFTASPQLILKGGHWCPNCL